MCSSVETLARVYLSGIAQGNTFPEKFPVP